MADQYFGKYTGVVRDNRDKNKLGVLQVEVPSIFPPDEAVPARAALPYGVFFVPEQNTKVWVEFEGGDPSLPLWTGVQYGPGDWAPEAAKSPPAVRAIKTVSGHLLVFDDTSGSEAVVITDGEHKHVIRLDKDGISIEHGSAGHKISVSAQEITVKHGSAPSQITLSATGVTAKTAAATIELAGPAVKLNGGSMPVVRAGVDIGIGNLGAPVVMQPGNPTVLA